MPIRTICPNPDCGKTFEVPTEAAGRRARCKRCNTRFVVREGIGQPLGSARASADVSLKEPVSPANAARVSSAAPLPSDAAAGPAREWGVGDVILDLYEVTGILGEGGMGKVYRVQHRGWNMELAVKSPRPKLLASPGAVENFVREAETWTNLGLHPHVAACFYVRQIGGIPRVFAELVSGGSLLDWIDDGRLYQGGPHKALERILDLGIQFAWGLHHAHEQGLVHQDVKPANVLLTTDATAKVADFGLAKARAAAGEGGGERSTSGLRSILVSSGGYTPAYCSPEQYAKAPLSRRTDIWSWAVSLLHMFKGEVSWRSGTVAREALEACLKTGPADESLPAMPDDVANLLRACLQHDPAARPAELRQVAERLRQAYAAATGQSYARLEPSAAEALADTLNNRAVSLVDLGRNDEAQRLLAEARAIDPQHIQATYNLGLLRWRGAEATDQHVVHQLEAVRTSHADRWEPLYLLGLVHLERDDIESALVVLQEAARQVPNNAQVQQALEMAQSSADGGTCCVRTEWKTPPLYPSDVAFSPDGRHVLAAGNGPLKLFDVASGNCVREFKGHRYQVQSVAISPDGLFALSGGEDKTVRVWEVPSGRCLRVFKGHDGWVNSVAFSPDSLFALSGSGDKTVRLWELPSARSPRFRLFAGMLKMPRRLWKASSSRCRRVFEGHEYKYGVQCVAMSTDGRLALSADTETLRLWEVFTGRCLRLFDESPAYNISVALSPDGRWALSGDNDDALRLWEVASGRCLRTLEGHTGAVHSVAYSRDGGRALSGSEDRTLRLWDVASGRCLRTLEGHTGKVGSVAFSLDGRLATSAGGGFRLWKLGDFRARPAALALVRPAAPERLLADRRRYDEKLQEARQAVAQGAIANALKSLAGARRIPGFQRASAALDLAAQLATHGIRHALRDVWHRRSFEGHSDEVQSVAFSPDGCWALSGGGWMDEPLRLWEIASGRCVRVFQGHTGQVRSVAFAADGRSAVSGSECGNGRSAVSGSECGNLIRHWDISSGRCLRTFEGCPHSINAVALSPDGCWLLTGSAQALRLWDVNSGRLARTIDAHARDISSVAFSPDGRYALAGMPGDKAVRLWELASSGCLRSLHGRTYGVGSVSFSPDGCWVLSGRPDHETEYGQPDDPLGLNQMQVRAELLRLWDVASGRCLCSFEGHAGFHVTAVFSPDGRWILSGSDDKTVRIWDVASRQCVRILEGHTKPVRCVAFSPDGRFVLSGSDDKTLRLWELDWEIKAPEPASWHDGARPYLEQFLTLHTPCAANLPDRNSSDPGRPAWSSDEVALALTRRGKPHFTEADVQKLFETLGRAGYGWLRPEGVRQKLDAMTRNWTGPPDLYV